jgi:glutaconate CoA-transferase subunit A
MGKSKIMKLDEMVREYVPSGSSVAIANFLHSAANDIVMEIIRQHITDLTIYNCSTLWEQDILVAGHCVKRIATAYSHRFSVSRNGTAIERAIRKKEIEYEEFTNYAMATMFQAGAMGLDFLPMLPAIGLTDFMTKTTWMGENKLKWIESPFTGKKYVAIPAVNPDVAIIHCQRGDKFGNLQYWGTMSAVRDSALAGKKIIATVEEIVDSSVIKTSPHNTIVPGFRVEAIAEVPWGSHPCDLVGCYALDYGFLAQFYLDQMSVTATKKFLQKWIYDIPDHAGYVEKLIDEFGQESLDRLKARFLPGAPANYGSTMKNMWCEKDGCYSPWIGLSKDEYLNYMKENLQMYKMEDKEGEN